jgi:hypothetical protein
MATGNLNNEKTLVDDGLDSIVIVKDLADLLGGCTLNVEDVDDDTTVIKSGHIIVKDDESGDYEPLGVSDDAYVTDTDGKTFVGVLKKTVMVSKPFAAVLAMGQVNKEAVPYEITSAIISALPHIQFI